MLLVKGEKLGQIRKKVLLSYFSESAFQVQIEQKTKKKLLTSDFFLRFLLIIKKKNNAQKQIIFEGKIMVTINNEKFMKINEIKEFINPQKGKEDPYDIDVQIDLVPTASHNQLPLTDGCSFAGCTRYCGGGPTFACPRTVGC